MSLSIKSQNLWDSYLVHATPFSSYVVSRIEPTIACWVRLLCRKGWTITYNDALQILQLQHSFTLDELKSAFRVAAKKYHPDVAGSNASAEKFIEANAAYEILLDRLRQQGQSTTQGGAFEQVVDDPILFERIELLERAFEVLMNDAQQCFEQWADAICIGVRESISSYRNKRTLAARFEQDVREIITYSNNVLFSKLQEGLSNLIKQNDKWLNDTFNFAFRRRRKEEIQKSLTSKNNYLVGLLMTLALTSVVVKNDLSYQLLLLSPIVVVLPVLVGVIRAMIKWREDRFFISITGASLLPKTGTFAPSLTNAWTSTETGAAGGIGGAVVGGAIGGPLGAIVGGLLGGIFGSLFGEPYEVTAQKVWQAFASSFESHANDQAKVLEDALRSARKELLARITENYNRSKEQALLALISRR